MHFIPRNLSACQHKVNHYVRTFNALFRNYLYGLFCMRFAPNEDTTWNTAGEQQRRRIKYQNDIIPLCFFWGKQVFFGIWGQHNHKMNCWKGNNAFCIISRCVKEALLHRTCCALQRSSLSFNIASQLSTIRLNATWCQITGDVDETETSSKISALRNYWF